MCLLNYSSSQLSVICESNALPILKPRKMALKSDAIFEKIKARLATIDPNNRQVLHVYKFQIKQGGKDVKSWSKFLINLY